jgi:hypothetical protein
MPKKWQTKTKKQNKNKPGGPIFYLKIECPVAL